MTDTTPPSEPTDSTEREAPWEPSPDPDPSTAEEGWAAEFDEAPKEDSLQPPDNPAT
ncbi:MAG: hypothetical protein JWN61_1181 [Pseudonocardiales bacterium]|nr:hypothetical protein [Pseudonocardiales bacterium]